MAAMSWSVDVFVNSPAPLGAFVREIEPLLGIKLQRLSASGETWYEFRDPSIALTVGDHELENDRDMNFEDYRYQISVRAINVWDWEKHQKRCRDFARAVFEKLKATGRYRLLLVEDIQKKLDEFHPEPALAR